MTPEQIEHLENSRLHHLGYKSDLDFTRGRFAIIEKYARRVTLIIYTDGKKACRFGRQPVEEQDVKTVSYPEVSEEEWRELQDDNTTLARVRAILDSLTNL